MMNMLPGAIVLALLATPTLADEASCQSKISSFDLIAMPFTFLGDVDNFMEAKKHRDAGALALARGDEASCLKHLRKAEAVLDRKTD